jgi:hypothetical protein
MAHNPRFNKTLGISPTNTAGQPASHSSDPLSGPGSGFAIDPQVVSGLPHLVNNLSFIIDEDSSPLSESDTPLSKPVRVIHSPPATLPQLLALLPSRCGRRPNPPHREEEFEDVHSESTVIDSQANRRTNAKKRRNVERLAKGNKLDHLHGEELEVGLSGFSHFYLSHFPMLHW